MEQLMEWELAEKSDKKIKIKIKIATQQVTPLLSGFLSVLILSDKIFKQHIGIIS
jgi:hypothetical protein